MGITATYATLILEKILDGIVLLGFLGTALIFAPFPDWLVETGVWALFGFGGSLMLLLVLNAAESNEHLVRWAMNSKIFEVILSLIRSLGRGLHGLRSRKRFIILFGFSLSIWVLEAIILWVAFRIFSLQLPPEAAIVTVVLLSVGTMLPAAPGFLGTYQFFILTALSLYQVPQTSAIALGVFLNLFIILITILTGGVALFLEGGLNDPLKYKRTPSSP